MIALFEKKVKLNKNVYTFYFSTKKAVNNVPGQYLELTAPHKTPDYRGSMRKFTIYSSPTEPLLAITTRISSKKSSFKEYLLNLKLGDKLTYTEPIGDFILPIDESIPLLFIASGIAITPVRSILKWLKDTNQRRDIKLIYATKHQSDFIERKLLSSVPVFYFVTKPSAKQQDTNEKLSLSAVKKLTPITSRTHVYISGTKKMVTTFKEELIKTGFPSNQIITDAFEGY